MRLYTIMLDSYKYIMIYLLTMFSWGHRKNMYMNMYILYI